MNRVTAAGEYFMVPSENLKLTDTKLTGKHSFQYVNHMEIENCKFDTKDAFWHSESVTVKNSVLKGEYLRWYSNHLTLINCKLLIHSLCAIVII